MMLKHVMIDLETLGTAVNAAILGIGACTFGHEGEQAQFYLAIDPVSAQRQGGRVDMETVMWWMKQGEEARTAAFEGTAHIGMALSQFSAWIKAIGPVKVWGNGASFDIVLLETALQRSRIDIPWTHKDHRCYRTLRSMADVPYEQPTIPHHALHDALAQAKHAEALCKRLGVKL
jgi:3' exoribonuclease, RNase T-like